MSNNNKHYTRKNKHSITNPKIIPENIRNFIKYNHVTGEFSWIKINTNSQKLTDKVGTIKTKGYGSVCFYSSSYLLHRVAWFLHYSEQPVIIDHINGDKLDNRIVNLRNCTNKQNVINAKISKNNTSGITGVSYNKKRRTWDVNIKINYVKKHLGTSKDINTAKKIRKEAEIKYFGEYRFNEDEGII